MAHSLCVIVLRTECSGVVCHVMNMSVTPENRIKVKQIFRANLFIIILLAKKHTFMGNFAFSWKLLS